MRGRTDGSRPPTAVAVLGRGAIGGPILSALQHGRIGAARLVAVGDSSGLYDVVGAPLQRAELVERADLVVEAAGQRVLAEWGPPLIAAGIDVLALSIGALADDEMRARLTAGPGRLYLSSGALGGLEVVRALADAGQLSAVRLTTTKRPMTLVQDWMDEATRASVLDAVRPIEILRGTPQRIAEAFPRSANVAMSVALAACDPALVEAAVVADPGCTMTSHVLEIDSPIGSYRFDIANVPSPDNPATSQLVALAALRALRDLCGRRITVL